MQYASTQQQIDRMMIKPKTTTVTSQRNTYVMSNQKGLGMEQSQIQGRASFTFQEQSQDDIMVSQNYDSSKNSNKKLSVGGSLPYESQGVDSSSSIGNQQMLMVSKKSLNKPNPQLKKKGLQQLPMKQSGVNLVNLNLNFSTIPQNQLPPTYPLVKNQENIISGQADHQKKRKPHQQIEPMYRGPQQNYNPNRLQKLQTLQPKSFLQMDEQLRGYSLEQQNQLGVIDLNSSSSVLTNSTNLTKNNLSSKQQLQSEVNQYQRDPDQSESPSYRMMNMNESNVKQICNHKQKVMREITNPFNPKVFGSNGNIFSQDVKGYKLDQISMDPSISSQEKMEKMMKSLESSASKVLQLKNKSKGTLDSQRNNQDITDFSKLRQTSQEKYDDSSLYNSSGVAPVPSKGKGFYQQNQKNGLTVNYNNSKNTSFNGFRNEPSSHQFLALKSEIDDRYKNGMIGNQGQQPQQMNQIMEVDFEQSQEGVRESFLEIRNANFSNRTRKMASNSVSREFESQNYSDQQESLKTFGVSSQQLQLQRKDLSNQRNFKTQGNQAIQQEGNNQQQQGNDPTQISNDGNLAQIQPQENKKTFRKIIDANPTTKLEGKRYSGVVITTNKSKTTTNQQTGTVMTQQQKDRLQKSDKDQQLQMKIKIYLDFQRIINFSNNMTMQNLPQNGVKLYKACITKGNNGVLIRACLKNRWWWSLSEQSEDYENINFLWTQWRKPLFFKIIKSRSELSITPARDEDQEINTDNKNKQDQYINETSQIGEKNQNAVESSSNESGGSANQLGEQQQLNKTKIDLGDNAEQEEDNLENEKQEIVSPTNKERFGYNDASPTKNLQDYIIKQTASGQKKLVSGSPIAGRKAGQQLSAQDPFCKIGALVNEKDLQLLQTYTKQSKKKKQAGGTTVPPVFTKEEYEQGIEKEYEKIRKDSNTQVTVFKNPLKQKMHNHMEFNFHLANKKALFYNMKLYYTLMNQNVFDFLPTTFHIQHGLNDPEFTNFVNYYNKFEAENPKRKNVWIIKPGESSNRGNGIQVAGDVNSVRDIIRVRESHQNGFKKTYIIQKYLDKPFLYNKRKFDIRCFMLMTNYNNTMKAYWYTDGYIRTSTKEFTLKNLENRMIHLTNEAVQKRGDDFGKFENGNKLSYAELQKYIDTTYPKENFNFMQQVYPQMKQLAYDSVCSVFTKIDKKKRNFSFELFGLDFMIDDSFKTWLIEINTNPSLTIAAPLMSRLLPALIDNVLKIAIDPIFPPPNFPKSKKHLIPEQIYENNKFELLFDSDVDGVRVSKLYQNVSNKIDEEIEEDCKNEEVYDDDDAEVDQDDEEEGC